LNQTIKEVKKEAQKVENQREWIREHMLKGAKNSISKKNDEAILKHCIEIVMKKPFWLTFFINSFKKS
jgi:hypothetical protein